MKNNVLDGKAFWARVKELYTQRRIKQIEVCNVTDMQYANFKNQASAGVLPNVSNVYSIAQLFGVTMEYLLTGTSDNPVVQQNVESARHIAELEKRIDELEQMRAKIKEIITD